MMRRVLVAIAVAAITITDLTAQAVPERSQAARVDMGYRRFSQFRIDPFRNVMIPHWGLVMSLGGTGENSAVNFADIGALKLLSDSGSLLIGDYLDAVGLVPAGRSARVALQAEGGLYLGGPFGKHLSVGVSLQGRGYGSFFLEEDGVTLIRDGNTQQSDFNLGNSNASAMATGEAGAHMVLRFGPLGTEDGVHLAFGFGARMVRPVAYAALRTPAASNRVIRATADSLVADLSIEKYITPLADFAAATDKFKQGLGGSLVGDFLLRLEWPTSGIAFEAMLANVGTATIVGVQRETARFSMQTADVRDVQTAIDTLTFTIQDTVDIPVSMPRILRFSAGAWANRVLQVDIAATMPMTGEFAAPMSVDLGTTWRFLQYLPLRAGLIIGGTQGLGYSAGFALEARNLFLQVAGQSLGGLLRNAKGAGARLDFGIFF